MSQDTFRYALRSTDEIERRTEQNLRLRERTVKKLALVEQGKLPPMPKPKTQPLKWDCWQESAVAYLDRLSLGPRQVDLETQNIGDVIYSSQIITWPCGCRCRSVQVDAIGRNQWIPTPEPKSLVVCARHMVVLDPSAYAQYENSGEHPVYGYVVTSSCIAARESDHVPSPSQS